MSNFRIMSVAHSGLLAALLLLAAGCDYLVSPQTRYERARDFVAQGEHRRALIELKNALQKEPELPGARLLLAEVALWLGDPTSAHRELQRASAQLDPVRYAQLQARIDLALGRHEELLRRLDAGEVAVLDPPSQAYFRGMALYRMRRPQEAQQAFQAALEADPRRLEAKIGLVDALVGNNETARALEMTQQLISDHPDAALAWEARGALLARRGDNTEAVEALQRAHKLAPKQLDSVQRIALLTELTETHLIQQDLESARARNAELGRLAPDSPIALITSARIAMAANDYATASSNLRRVVNSNPRLTQARFLLGVALLSQGNLEQASQELAAVVDQTPEHVEARQLLAQVRMRQDDPNAAMRLLVPALQSGSADSRLSALMDTARMRAGGSSQAIALLESALQRSPESDELKVQLAGSYLQGGQADKAIALLRNTHGAGPKTQREALLLQAISQAQGNAAARSEVDAMVAANLTDVNVLALAASFYAHAGDLQAGRRLLMQALQRDGRNIELWFALARLEWSAQQPAGARTALQQLLAIEPANASARLMLAQIDYGAGDVDAARTHLEAARQSEPRAVLPRLLLARIALTRDDAATASALIAEAIKTAPSRADVQSAAGSIYLNSGRFDQAIGHFQTAAKMAPGEAGVWLNLGRAQQALGQSGPARESLQRALSVQPGWLLAEGALAFIDVQEGQVAAARERIAALKQRHARNAAAFDLAGEVFGALRDYSEAANAFDAAYNLQPSGLLAFKAYEARRAARQPKPFEPLERWIEQHPEDLTYRSALADAYILSGERQRAVEQYERILATRPNHVPSMNNLAWLYFELNDKRAESMARKANSLAPGVAAVSDTLGWILVQSGRAAEGLPILKAAASGSAANPEIRYHYAVALEQAGSAQAARDELASLLRDHARFPSRPAAEALHERIKGGPSEG